MKRYILFGFDQYYPGGGVNDILQVFDGEDELEYEEKRKYYDYYQVMDREHVTVGVGDTPKKAFELLERLHWISYDESKFSKLIASTNYEVNMDEKSVSVEREENVPSWMESEESEKEFNENCKAVLKMFENRDKKMSDK